MGLLRSSRFISRRILAIAVFLEVGIASFAISGSYAEDSSGERRTFEGPLAEPSADGSVASYYQSKVVHLDVPTPIPVQLVHPHPSLSPQIPVSTPSRQDFQKILRHPTVAPRTRNILTPTPNPLIPSFQSFRPQLQSPSTAKPYPLEWKQPVGEPQGQWVTPIAIQSHPSPQTFAPHLPLPGPTAAYYRGGPNPSVKTPDDDVILRNPASFAPQPLPPHPTRGPHILNPSHTRSYQKVERYPQAEGVTLRSHIPLEGSFVATTPRPMGSGRTYEDKVTRGEDDGGRNRDVSRGKYPQVKGSTAKDIDEETVPVEKRQRSRPTGYRRYSDKKGLGTEKNINSEGKRGRAEISGGNEPRGYAVAGATGEEIVSAPPAKERQRFLSAQNQERRNDERRGRYRIRGGDSEKNREQEIEEEGVTVVAGRGRGFGRNHDRSRNEEDTLSRKRINDGQVTMGRGRSRNVARGEESEEQEERRDSVGRGKRPRRLPEDADGVRRASGKRGRADDAQETVQKHARVRSRPDETRRPLRTEDYSSDETNHHLRRRKQRPFSKGRDVEEDDVAEAEETSADEVKTSEGEESQDDEEEDQSSGGHGGGGGGGDGGGEKKHEEGGGEEEEEEHHESHGEEAEKGYKGEHKYEKAAEGKHDKEEHKGEEGEEGGHKEGHHESGDYFGEEHGEHKGEKSDGFEDEGKYKKGHSTKGTHEVHKKDEYANNHEFFDDYEDDGHHDKEGAFEEDEDGEKGGHHKKEHHDSEFEHGDHHKKGKHLKGHYYDEEEGHDHKDGEEEEHGHKEEYGKKSGHKKYIKKGYSEEGGGGKDGGGGGKE
ncbi:hypothetical protein J437_LFUL004147 [Ladona fulva]|uniref:Uncharacterized protein n=1 Tax=Ladona fulva TaxID=123851 RepID=A0A8K0NXU9_LADFU|nr:hypothetical protein J437_LFUL004147 [Ladona fulva]